MAQEGTNFSFSFAGGEGGIRLATKPIGSNEPPTTTFEWPKPSIAALIHGGGPCTLELKRSFEADHLKVLVRDDGTKELVFSLGGLMRQERFWLHEGMRFQEKQMDGFILVDVFFQLDVLSYSIRASSPTSRRLDFTRKGENLRFHAYTLDMDEDAVRVVEK